MASIDPGGHFVYCKTFQILFLEKNIWTVVSELKYFYVTDSDEC